MPTKVKQPQNTPPSSATTMMIVRAHLRRSTPSIWLTIEPAARSPGLAMSGRARMTANNAMPAMR